jgi:hypothetical protein
MRFIKALFGKKDKTEEKKLGIGELDKCPYCKEKLDKIPTRKSKCPHCNEYMYSRTRPSDRTKVLVTEKQKEEIELEWIKYHETQEENNLMENDDFSSAKKDLTKQFGKEPSLNDVKWRVYNQRILEYASQRQWGLYRNNKLDMAFLLQKENKLKQALMTMFEVLYLDVNGGRNYGFTGEQLEELGIKEFDPKSAFLAPGVISPVQDIITELKLSMKDSKELFIQTNNKMKPSKNMPVTEEKAWEKIQKEISIREANSKKIEEFDPEDTDSIINEIKSSNKETLSSIVYKFRNQYKNKSAIVPNKNKIERVIEELLITNEETKSLGQSLLLFYLKKDKELFLPLTKKYVQNNRKYFEKCPEEHTIGEIGKIDSDLVKDYIPIMIKELKSNSEWNTRRFIAFNLGAIGSKNSEAVKEAIPIMIEYIKNPIEVTKREPTRVEAKGIVIEMNLSAENMLGVDQTQWLKDAYIDSLGMIAQGDKDLIKPYKALFEKIAKKDKSEYSRKKASAVLENL